MSTLTTAHVLRRAELRRDTLLVDAIQSFWTSNYRIAKKTREFYEGNFRAFVLYADRQLGRPPVISDLEPGLVEPYLGLLARAPTAKYPEGSPFRTRAAATSLKRLSNWLAKDGLLTDRAGNSLLRSVQKPNEPEGVRQPLTDDELDSVMIAAGRSGERDYTLIVFGLGTGLRLSELRLLRVGDVLFEDHQVRIRAETSKFKRPRTVDYHPEVAKEIDRYLRTRPILREEMPMFPNQDGAHFTDDGFQKLFQRLAKKSGVRRFSAHLLRHTWATRFGGNLLKLKRQGGWRRMDMVIRYDHADDITDPDVELTNPLARKQTVGGRYTKAVAADIIALADRKRRTG